MLVRLPFSVNIVFEFFMIIDRMQLNEIVSTVPTIGFNIETVKYKNLTFQVWDLGGQTSIRPYWRCYFNNTGNYSLFDLELDAVIYVVDSADIDRLSVAKAELAAILKVIPFLSF